MDSKVGINEGLLVSGAVQASNVYTSSTGDGAAAAAVRERGETVLLEGRFSPDYVQYTFVMGVLLLIASFAWPVLFFLPCIFIGIKAQFASFRVVLSDKSVTFNQGKYACCCMCWGSSERIVPLEKITDCTSLLCPAEFKPARPQRSPRACTYTPGTWVQGCLQRRYGLEELNIRTAAGSMGGEAGGAGSSADIHLVGLVDAKNFRSALMRAKDQRDHFLATGVVAVDGEGSAAPTAQRMQGLAAAPAPVVSSPESTAVLTTMNETLSAIKDLLVEKASVLEASVPVTDVESGGR